MTRLLLAAALCLAGPRASAASESLFMERYESGLKLQEVGLVTAGVGAGTVALTVGSTYLSARARRATEESLVLSDEGTGAVLFGSLVAVGGLSITVSGVGRSTHTLRSAGVDLGRTPGFLALGCLGVSALTAYRVPVVSPVAAAGALGFGYWQLRSTRRAGAAFSVGPELRLAPLLGEERRGLALTGTW